MLPTTDAIDAVSPTQRVLLYVCRYGTRSPAVRSCCTLADSMAIARVLRVKKTMMITALMRAARNG